uniref:RNA-directed RNA polymerase n=1 Tax=Thrips tabaci associated tombus-like virus 1 TaxID=2767260 RepID=A0A7G9IR83_9TOMB|nr:hypothetical protein [Thrips tabaci associated tombus-like virus 1]
MEELRIKNGLQPNHKIVNMFVKPDRLSEEGVAEKAPRAIQFRHPCFNLVFSKYTKPMEHEFYPKLTYGNLSGTRAVAKGLNNYERAELVLDKASYFDDPAYLLIDHSKFDSTINVDHLKSTHRKYNSCFHSAQLRKLLEAQLKCTGYTKSGIKYATRGTRMSGDADTGLGNTIVNLDCLWGFLYESGINKYDMLLDGDDSIVIVERADLVKLRPDMFGKLGFDTKLDIVTDIADVEFCQCKIIFAERPVFSRDPMRVLSHVQSMRTRPCKWEQVQEWMAGVGACEVACNAGVPVLQVFGEFFKTPKAVKVDEDFKHRWDLHRGIQPTVISNEARVSFARAWGIDIHTQLLMELEGFNPARTWCKRTVTEFQLISAAQISPIYDVRDVAGYALWQATGTPRVGLASSSRRAGVG